MQVTFKVQITIKISYINVQKSTDFKPQEMKERKKERKKERREKERKKNPGKLPGRSTTSIK